MTVVEDRIGAGGLIARVKNLLFTPKAEWERIDPEPTSIRSLYLGYVCILAAIPGLASIVGKLAFGFGFFGWVWRPSPVGVVTSAVVAYLLSLVAVAVVALVVDALAPSFGGTPNRIQAFKVAAYSYTAAWVAGVLNLVPAWWPLAALLGLYSFYLLYLGLPRLMKAPEDKAVGYTVVTVVVALVVYVVVGSIAGAVTASTVAMSNAAAGVRAAGHDGGTVTINGRTLDVDRMRQAARQMEAAARGERGAVKAVEPDVLKGLLPAVLPGFSRSEVSTGAAGAAGLGGSNAQARYDQGTSSIRLGVTDLSSAGALATLGGVFGVQSSRETATSYEKTGLVDGRMTTEEYDRSTRSGKYMTVVGERFVVEAEGEGVEMGQLKAAVKTVDAGRLERMARG